jgi:O-acetyl-ADP-ribose deacetylase (regulator of RNase III)
VFCLAGSDCRIAVISGSIRRVHCADIWVNPENTDMEMARITEFSISAIIRYEGASLDEAGLVTEDLVADELAAVVTTRPVAAGTAVVTGSGRLAETHNVQFIIHVAAVQGEPGGGFRQVRNTGACVTNALVQAERLARAGHKANSVLIPMLGVGMGGGQVEPTIQTLLSAAVDHLTETSDTAIDAVYFLAYTDAEYTSFMDAISTSQRLSPISPPA